VRQFSGKMVIRAISIRKRASGMWYLARRWSRRVTGSTTGMKSAAEFISGLRSSAGPMETLSLNKARVRENFISQIGAIESYTREAARNGNLEIPPVNLGASFSSQAGATWGFTDPLTQALILRVALDQKQKLHDIKDAQPGDYVLSSGVGAISRSGMLDDLHRERLSSHRDLYEKLEAERAKQERIMHMTGGRRREHLWLLTIDESNDENAAICAATIEGTALRDPFRHWVYAASPWQFFGMVRCIHETKIPWLAPLHLYVKLNGSVASHS
jgi:hypothetical protein